MNGIRAKIFREVKNFPPASWKNVFILIVPRPVENLPWVRIFLLYARITDQPHVLLIVEPKQRPRLSSRLSGNQLVKRLD